MQKPYAFYRRNERYAPLLFFFGGVVWDALTLDRIDAWFDNALLLLYLSAVTVLLAVSALVEHNRTKHPWCLRYREWFPHAIQFFLGALFSAHVVFYFQSADLGPTAVFLVILMVLLVANEFIHQRMFNLYLLFALYFLACASFFIFFIPVVTKTMNYQTFIGGALLGLVITGGMVLYLAASGVFQKLRQLYFGLGVVALLFGMLNVFYLQNWIPPVPLAMRYGEVFHHVQRADGVYELHYEPADSWWAEVSPTFHRAEGERVYCFAAVFAPTDLKTRIYHKWQHFDEAQQAWVMTDDIPYNVLGGRNRGFRGYTYKQNLSPGRWRVDVETEDGRLIGRIPFRIVPVNAPIANLRQRFYE